MSRLIILFCGLFLALYGCDQKQVFSSEISTIDSLYATVGQFESRISTIDSSKVKAVLARSTELNDYLTKNYPDTNDRDFWINDMNDLYEVKRGLEKYSAKSDFIVKEIKYCKTQLLSLRKSLDDEKLDQQKAVSYLEIERKAVENLEFLVEKLQPRAEKSLNTWGRINEEIEALADSIKEL